MPSRQTAKMKIGALVNWLAEERSGARERRGRGEVGAGDGGWGGGWDGGWGVP